VLEGLLADELEKALKCLRAPAMAFNGRRMAGGQILGHLVECRIEEADLARGDRDPCRVVLISSRPVMPVGALVAAFARADRMEFIFFFPWEVPCFWPRYPEWTFGDPRA
jgi:hypothetical protein